MSYVHFDIVLDIYAAVLDHLYCKYWLFTLQAQNQTINIRNIKKYVVGFCGFLLSSGRTAVFCSSDPKLHRDLCISEKNIYLSSVT